MMRGALLLLAAVAGGEPQVSEDELLAQADLRIREHRTRVVTLRLTDDVGKLLPDGAEVEVEQTRHAFLFGCNIFALNQCRTPEDNAAYSKGFADLLNYATLPFYWWSYERRKGEPDDARTEELARWCREHGVTMKGHPLAWNYVDPTWLPDDTQKVMELQIQRIGDCVRRFRGTIDLWDVVNEATHYDRESVRTQAPKLTRAIDEAGVGAYVRAAFRAAREANPEAVLVINDYRLDPEFESRVLRELVDGDGKALFDVIGLQSHQHGGARPIRDIWQVCQRYQKYGKPLHWTENTFVSGEQGYDLPKKRPGFRWVSTPEGEARQARDATRYYTVLFSHPAVEAITWWDFSDQRAWQSAPAGLVRADMSPKPAYEALRKLIHEAWWTKSRGKIGADGSYQLRGFYGDYAVRVTVGERILVGSMVLRKDSPESIDVRLAAR